MRKVGDVGPLEVAGVEAALQDLYGTGIDGLQAQWVAYWKEHE